MSSPVTLRGRLTKDPEMRFTNGGVALAQFTVVTSRRFKDQNGDWQEKDVSFWDVTAFDKLAEQIAENCVKGTSVIVVGSMFQEKWVNKEGENRTSWKVTAESAGPDWRFAPRSEGSSVPSRGNFSDPNSGIRPELKAPVFDAPPF
jgi:single-strand DNA-binding protein